MKQHPDQRASVGVGGKEPRDRCQAACRARRANQKKGFAAQLVDQTHADDGEDQIGESDGDGLLVAGDLAEAGGGEDAVQVIEDGVDAGKLVECADGNRQKERIDVLLRVFTYR